MAFGAVVDEACLERGLDAGDDGLVDVGLPLLLGGGLDVEVDELLTVDDGHPELLGLGGVEQHSLHACFPGARHGTGARACDTGAGFVRRSRSRPEGTATRRRDPKPGARAAVAAGGRGTSGRGMSGSSRGSRDGGTVPSFRRGRGFEQRIATSNDTIATPAHDGSGQVGAVGSGISLWAPRSSPPTSPAPCRCGDCANPLPSLLSRFGRLRPAGERLNRPGSQTLRSRTPRAARLPS